MVSVAAAALPDRVPVLEFGGHRLLGEVGVPRDGPGSLQPFPGGLFANQDPVKGTMSMLLRAKGTSATRRWLNIVLASLLETYSRVTPN